MILLEKREIYVILGIAFIMTSKQEEGEFRDEKFFETEKSPKTQCLCGFSSFLKTPKYPNV